MRRTGRCMAAPVRLLPVPWLVPAQLCTRPLPSSLPWWPPKPGLCPFKGQGLSPRASAQLLCLIIGQSTGLSPQACGGCCCLALRNACPSGRFRRGLGSRLAEMEYPPAAQAMPKQPRCQ